VNLLQFLFPLAFLFGRQGRSFSLARDGLACCGLGTWGAVASAAITAVGTASAVSAQRKAAAAQKDAMLRQQDIADKLKYEPINLENLKEQTRQQAIANATQSLALERELTPEVAATRQMVAERVRSDLALGGALSPDVANQVARASRTMGAMSGAPAGPLTAAQIGLTAEGLRSQRLGQANQLLQMNPLRPVGLDPGALASAIVGQNAAINQFNASKAGINANLAQSAGQVAAAQAAGQHSSNMAILNALPSVFGGIKALGGAFSAPSTPSTGGAGMGLLQNYTPLSGAAPFSTAGIPNQVSPTTPGLFNYSFGPPPG
jgi:hypothetical protein